MPKVNNKKGKGKGKRNPNNKTTTIHQPPMEFKNQREQVKWHLKQIFIIYSQNKEVITDENDIVFTEHIVQLRGHLDIYCLIKNKIDGYTQEVEFIHQKNRSGRMSTHFSANAYLKDKVKIQKILELLDKLYEKRRNVTGDLIKDLNGLRNQLQVQCHLWKKTDGRFELYLIPENNDRRNGKNWLWMKKHENRIRQWLYQNKQRSTPLEPDQVFQYVKNQYVDVINNIYKNIMDQIKNYEQIKTFIKCYYDAELFDLLFKEQKDLF